MSDVRFRAGDQVVESENVPSLRDQAIAEMRTKETRSAGNYCTHAPPEKCQLAMLSRRAAIDHTGGPRYHARACPCTAAQTHRRSGSATWPGRFFSACLLGQSPSRLLFFLAWAGGWLWKIRWTRPKRLWSLAVEFPCGPRKRHACTMPPMHRKFG